MGFALRNWSKRLTSLTIASVFAFGILAAAAPVFLTQKAEALAASTVYKGLADSQPAAYPSLGYAATSTKEFGDKISLSQAGTKLSSVVISLTSWACQTGGWTTNDCYTAEGATFSHPITVNLYNVATDGTVGTLLATKTQNVDALYRPSADTTNCSGGKWFNVSDSTCYNGIAFDTAFDFSSQHVTLPSNVIATIAYNTSSYGTSPLGVTGPYDSLNVSLPGSGPTIGTDLNTDEMFWDTTYPGYTGELVADSGWSPYHLAMNITSTPANTAPSIAFNSPTPADNSYVKGTVTGNVTATDDYGMGSYYLRFWKDSFESGIANLLNSCYLAPGAYLLGTTETASCSFDTTSLPNGTKIVFSAQFLDGDIAWGLAKRTFTVDNTNPEITIKTGTGVNDGTTGTNPYSQISFKLHDNLALKEVVLNGNTYSRGGTWNDLNWLNITKSQLIEGSNTIIVRDQAGNQSQIVFDYDKTSPVAPVLKTASPYIANGATKTLEWFPSTSGDIAYYEYAEYNGTAPLSPTTTPSWLKQVSGTTTTDTAWGSDVTIYWRVRAVDFAGNKSAWSETRQIITDRTAPTGTADLPQLVRGSINITQTVNDTNPASGKLRIWKLDSGGNLDNTKFFAIGNLPVNGSNQVSYFLNSLSNLYGDGNYVAKFTSTDIAGNATVLQINFTVDNTGPTITVKPESIGSGSTWSNVSFQLFDANQVDKLTLNGVEKDLTDNNWSDLNGVTVGQFGAIEGLNTLVVYDVAGNSTTLVFTIDTTAPVLTPGDAIQNSDGSLTTNITIDDASGVTYQWVGEATNPESDSSVISDPTILNPTFSATAVGVYTYHLIATDLAGNTDSTIEFSFEILAPVVPETPQTPAPAPTAPAPTNVRTTNTGVLGASTNTPNTSSDSTDQTNTQSESVLGDSTDNTDKTNDSKGSLAWYWWLLIAIGAIFLGWLLAFWRSRGDDEK